MQRNLNFLKRVFSTQGKDAAAAQASGKNILYQVWGANTDVGKSILSAALLKAVDAPALYIKPVQTGYPSSDDSAFVNKFAKNATTSTLVAVEAPVSPDLAFDIASIPAVPEHELRRLILNAVYSFNEKDLSQSAKASTIGVIETAGGVLSPVPSGQTQADFYRQFRFPGVLVGDSKLGGISTTLGAYEALRLRGYDVPAIVLFPEHGSILENEHSIERNVDLEYTSIFRAPNLPAPENSLEEYFENADVVSFFQNLLGHIRFVNAASETSMAEMLSDAKKIFWYPFTQHENLDKILCIDSAYGDNYACFDPDTGFSDVADAFGSWWTTGVGHGNVGIARAMGNAAGRYGHVTLPGAVHENAFKLAKLMLNGPGKGWASRVFFSDNGSTALEVALKMAFRKRSVDFPERAHLTQKIVGIEGAYHGDTLGVMDCAPESDYNRKQTPWYKPRGLFFEPPLVSILDGVWTLDIPSSLQSNSGDEKFFGGSEAAVESSEYDGKTFTSRDQIFDSKRDGAAYSEFIAASLDAALSSGSDDLGALIIEPVVQAAGGMRVIDPAFQRALIREARKREIPVIFDEVFTGLWRLGSETGAELLGEAPDIAAYAKLLTGGTVPLSLTLAAGKVFNSFLGQSTKDALLHGHSYTGHPIGCAAALESLKQYAPLSAKRAQSESIIRYWDEGFAKELSCFPGVVGITEIGTVLAVELEPEGGEGYAATGSLALQKRLLERGVMTRPLGNVLYVMVSPVTEQKYCKSLSKIISDAILSMNEPNHDVTEYSG